VPGTPRNLRRRAWRPGKARSLALPGGADRVDIMKHHVKAIVLALALTMVPWLAVGQNSATAPGAKVEKLAGGFAFTEGPTCDAAGNLFFTDQPNDRILKWSADGKLSTFLQPAGRANGMYFDRSGNLIACADEKTALWSIAPDGKVTVILNEYGGKPLNGPNDVWVRPDGGLYITDPFYKRPWWTHDTMPQDGQHVYFLAADRRQLVRVVDDLTKPNGIIGTPDGKTLYVSDFGAKKTYRYDIAPDGRLTRKTLVAAQGSDGMTLDSEGHLYLTGDGVMVFDKAGRQVEQIRIPGEAWTANVSFCGTDRRTLFITAGTSLYAVRMRVKGANAAK
jgi:gluconolactonase